MNETDLNVLRLSYRVRLDMAERGDRYLVTLHAILGEIKVKVLKRELTKVQANQLTKQLADISVEGYGTEVFESISESVAKRVLDIDYSAADDMADKVYAMMKGKQ